MVKLEQMETIYPVTSGSLVIKENAYNSGKFLIKDLLSHKSGFANEDLIKLLLLCDGSRNLQEIIDSINDQYDETKDEIGRKIKESLQYLQRLGYIKFAEKQMHCPITFHRKSLEWSLDVVYLEVTDLCNLSCLHCYAKTNSETETIKTADVFNLIDDLAKIGILKIIFTGGEPLLREDIFEILHYTKSRKIGFTLFTNGTLLNKDTIMELKILNPEGVAVSLDSSRAEIHDMIRGRRCFSNIVKGVELLISEKIPVRINYTILKGINDTIEDIEDAITFFISMGVNDISIGPVMAYGKGRENQHFILSPSEWAQIASIVQGKLKNYQLRYCQNKTPILRFSDSFADNKAIPYSICGIGTCACCIKANGDVVLCPVLREKNYCGGNVLKEKIDNIWLYSDIFQQFRKNTVEDIPECQKCPAKLNCAGGCKARALMYNGRFNSPDPWRCSIMKKMISL
jgi:radical SAM protein with 4Fe4S-binding SPASM domain